MLSRLARRSAALAQRSARLPIPSLSPALSLSLSSSFSFSSSSHSQSDSKSKSSKSGIPLLPASLAALLLLYADWRHDGLVWSGLLDFVYSRGLTSHLLSALFPSEAFALLSFDPADLTAHQNDSSSYHEGPPPLAVAYPRSIAEVQLLVSSCSRWRVPIIPYGSGLSLEGHTSAPFPAITLNMSKMSRILQVYPEDLQVRVEPGITWNELNEELKRHSLFFPVDPGPGSSIGGMIGTNCSGTNAVRYGTMKQNVVSLKVVDSEGSLLHTGHRAKKSSAGFDLTRLFTGSEGTLGIVVEAVLKVQKIPDYTSVARVQFPSIRAAASAAIEIETSGIPLGAIELLDDQTIKVTNAYCGMNNPERPTLFLKFTGSKKRVEDEIQSVKKLVERHSLPGTFEFSRSAAENERLWDARKQALWAAMAYDSSRKVWTTDVCVPLSKLADCIEATQIDIRDKAPHLMAPIVAHAGDGNFHVLFVVDPANEKELSITKELNERMVKRAIEVYEGTSTGEHGVGVGKREYLPQELGVETVETMKKIKRALDPKGIFNPGKIFLDK